MWVKLDSQSVGNVGQLRQPIGEYVVGIVGDTREPNGIVREVGWVKFVSQSVDKVGQTKQSLRG